MIIPDTKASIDAAVDMLRSGGLIALPTDTLYALAASASDATAVRRAFAIKGRDGQKPLPLLVSDGAMAERAGILDNRARRLIERFWPGALTIVVDKQPQFQSEALAAGSTVALRAPDHALTLEVIRRLDGPVTGTSANLSGGPDPDSVAEVHHQIGNRLDLVIDAGVCPAGISSTIVDCSGAGWRILRTGVISEAAVLDALDLEGRPAS